MTFSVIMPSYLGDYQGSTKNKPAKLIRAVETVIYQTFTDWELIVVADGCKQTVEVLRDKYDGVNIKGKLIPKQPLWSGTPRNVGIDVATGEWIIYLDIDDCWGRQHLETVEKYLTENIDFVYFNDYLYNKKRSDFIENPVNLDRKFRCGTSNICHRRALRVRWDAKGKYDHDWDFIRKLSAETQRGVKIPTPQYYVCHIPYKYDI